MHVKNIDKAVGKGQSCCQVVIIAEERQHEVHFGVWLRPVCLAEAGLGLIPSVSVVVQLKYSTGTDVFGELMEFCSLVGQL